MGVDMEKESATHSSILAQNRCLHRWRSLAGHSPRGQKELDMTERLHLLSLIWCKESESRTERLHLLSLIWCKESESRRREEGITFMSRLRAAQCGVSEPKQVNEGIFMEGWSSMGIQGMSRKEDQQCVGQHGVSESVLVFLGCCNKASQTGWFKTTEMCCLRVLGATSLKAWCL